MDVSTVRRKERKKGKMEEREAKRSGLAAQMEKYAVLHSYSVYI